MSALSGGGGGARTSAADTVSTLLQLYKAASEAQELGRRTRCLELCERALAAAEASSLPRDSLIWTTLLDQAVTCRSVMVADVAAAEGTPRHVELVDETWRSDEQLLTLARKSLMLCNARWLAGTLFTPTPEEVAFFDADGISARFAGAVAYLLRAKELLFKWPPPKSCADETARMHIVHGALQVCLEAERRGVMHRQEPHIGLPQQAHSNLTGESHGAAPRGGNTFGFLAHILLMIALDASRDGVWNALRAACVIPAEEEAALRQLAERSEAVAGKYLAVADKLAESGKERQQRAAADVARHGLRACALPECQQTEPEPKTFKVCGRCRAVVYCSAAHQQQDWKRHKRTDGCKTQATAAAGE
jgi:hypothetical protein